MPRVRGKVRHFAGNRKDRIMLQTSTLRPGLLVGLKTTLRGNVSYVKRSIEPDHATGGNERRAVWETERTIANAAEFDAAGELRGKAAYQVRRICAATAFGYLCPEEKAGELEEAIRTAREMIEGFNATASVTRVSLFVITGRVAPDDVEAVRAIRAEVAGLCAEMETGVQSLSPEKIRDAAKRAKEIGSMLSDSGRSRVAEAVDAARRAANVMAKAVRTGDQAAIEVDKAVLSKLADARTAFLDLDEAGEVASPDEGPARGIDFDPSPIVSAPAMVAAPSFDLF